MSIRAAVVRDGDGLVINVIVVEDLSHPVGDGHILIDAKDAGPGWTWDERKFIKPVVVDELSPSIEPTSERIWSALKAKGIVSDIDLVE